MSKYENEQVDIISTEEVVAVYEIQQVKLRRKFTTLNPDEKQFETESSLLSGRYSYQVTNSIRLDNPKLCPDDSDGYSHEAELTAYRLVKQDDQTVLYYAKTKAGVEDYLEQLLHGKTEQY
ncbi:MAG: hypothetical protein J6C49_04125 [Elusimicrobiaceae bacterium]|nr:hypothetical protein [Elusimicrobiaceae bacterium]